MHKKPKLEQVVVEKIAPTKFRITPPGVIYDSEFKLFTLEIGRAIEAFNRRMNSDLLDLYTSLTSTKK
jgi:hypothetical protein